MRSCLYLCGTERLARGVREELAARSGGVVFEGSVATLDAVLESYTLPAERVPDEEFRLRLWAELRRQDSAQVSGGTLGFVNALAEAWSVLCREGRYEGEPWEDPALSPLLAPLHRVREQLQKEGRKEKASLLRELPHRVLERPVRLECLVVEGFEGFPPLLSAIIDALASGAGECWVLTEGETLHPPHWEVPREGPSALPPGRRGSGPTPRAVPATVLGAWARASAVPEVPTPLPKVRLLSHLAGEREETEAFAREARRILEAEPTASVVVAVPALPTYAPRIRETFPRYGLRPQVRLPPALLASSGAQPVRRLLELVRDDLPHASMMELLEDLEALGTLEKFFGAGTRAGPIDRRTREARAVAGAEAFTRQLSEHATELRQEGDQEEAEAFDRMAAGFGRLLEVLAPLKGTRTPSEFLAILRTIHTSLGYPSGPGTGGPVAVLDGLEELFRSLERSRPDWTFGDLAQLLEVALAITSGRERAPLPGILVTGLHDAGLLDADHVLLGGLSENLVPADRPSPLIPAASRARAGLPGGEELVQRERVRLARVLARARVSVVLSYPSRSGESEVLPSLLLNDLLACSSPVLVANGASPGTSGPACSLEEAQVLVGRTLGAAPAGPAGELTPPDGLRDELQGPRSASWAAMLRGMSVERERRRAPRGSPWDGPRGEVASRELARRRFPAGRFTVHDVQDYLHCPYRFYLERVLGLEAPEEVSDEVDRADLGSKVHRALFEMLGSLRGPDHKLLPFTQEAFHEKAPELHRNLSEFLGRIRPRSPDVESVERRLLGPPGAPEQGALHSFLRHLLTDAEGVRVAYLELPFDDRVPRDPAQVDPGLRLPPLPLGEVDGVSPRLVGRIDRVGFSRHRPAGLVIDDYKTGRGRPKDQDSARDQVPQGRELQLPLYMAAALYGLRPTDPSAFPYGMRFVWLSSALESGFVPFLAFPQKEKDEPRQLQRGIALVELAVRHASTAARGVLEGRFPVNGRFHHPDGGCAFASYCEHARGCRFSRPRFAGQGAP
ncbi:MAG: PD-(D/E)XK nuclease family protein [Thermoplasmata archaeon]|nr:PD-(D/E)XK nuclease family protein [Thermoplasmata archaeon]